jgi:hypothetical protein
VTKLEIFKQYIKEIDALGTKEIESGTTLMPAELIAEISVNYYRNEVMNNLLFGGYADDITASNVIPLTATIKPPVDTL